MPEPLATLIVDDEPLAVERLQMLCAEIEGVKIAGTASDGAAALRLIDVLKPDLVLLDISMPEMDGMSAVQRLAKRDCEDMPAIVLVTAHDQFAVEAFDLPVADYLLKPVAADRLARAVERAAAWPQSARKSLETGQFASEFWVPYRSELVRIAVEDIDRIDAERDYMRLHVGNRSFLLHQTISRLEERLDPARFIRLHRSTIVRRDRVSRLGHDRNGAWHAELDDGTTVRIGRTYLTAAKRMAGR